MSNKPLISIGMPVYNNVDTISEAIETILNQSISDFELTISDNASTDGTEMICKRYAEKDSRITYIRQNKNTGTYNFIFVYKKARGEFFMWAPAHYSRSLDFIEKSLEVLRKNPSCTFAATPNCWRGKENETESFLKFSFEGTPYERIFKYLDLHMQSHACFYGLFRYAALEGAEDLEKMYIAVDNVFIIRQLLKGEFKRSNDGLLIVGHGQSANPDYIATFQTRPIHYILPYYDFSKNAINMIIKSDNISMKEKIILTLKILGLNAKVYKMIIKYWLLKITKKVGFYEFLKKIKK